MHPKTQGILGEVAVAKNLIYQGYPVFTEIGDLSRVDLIVLVNRISIRLQVKTYANSSNGTAFLTMRKHTLDPRYDYVYEEGDVDIFSLYIVDRDLIVYIASSEATSNRNSVKFGIGDRKSKRVVEDYADFLTAVKKQGMID